MKRIKQLLVLVSLLLVVSPILRAQATLTSTTLSAAVTSASVTTFRVASATDFTAANYAFVDREAIQITSVSGTVISGVRGAAGTTATTHASGARVYVGPPYYFTSSDRAGSCTSTNERVLPLLNISNGKLFQCVSSIWVEDVSQNGVFLSFTSRPTGNTNGDYSYLVNLTDNGGSSSGALTGGAAQKTYGLNISLNRPSTSAATGDSNDALIKVSANNYAVNDTNYILRGVNVGINNRSPGVMGLLESGSFGAQNKSGATTTTLRGLEVHPENYGSVSGEMGGVDVNFHNEGAAATTQYAYRARNGDQSNVAAVTAAYMVSASSGNTTGFNNGVDLNGAVINDADLRTHKGNGIWSGSGAPTAGDCATATLGSIYLNLAGGANTSVYFCQTAGGWDAVTP